MIWIQQPLTPQSRWRLHVDAAFDVEHGLFVTGVQVYDEDSHLVGALTHVSKRGVEVDDLSAWIEARLAEVHDALVPTFP